MKVTVAMPIYNAEKTLGQALHSVMQQTFTDFEVLMINDGSTDDSIDYMAKYSQWDKRFKQVHLEHAGVCAARNHAFKIAKGEFICFIDADDTISPDRLKNAVDAAEKFNADVVQCGLTNGRTTLQTNRNGWLYFGDERAFRNGNYDVGYSCTKLYRMSFIKEHRLQWPDADYMEDWIFNMRAWSEAGRFYIIQSPDYNYIVHGDSLMHKSLSEERRDKTISAFDSMMADLDKKLTRWQKGLMEHFIIRGILRKFNQ